MEGYGGKEMEWYGRCLNGSKVGSKELVVGGWKGKGGGSR